MTSLVEIRKAVSADKKRKEQQFGLANNAFGATAGALATRSVYREKRKLHLPGREAKYQAKVAARAERNAGKTVGPIKRAIAHVGSKVPEPVKRYGAPAAVAGAVGMQLVNAGADAQSAAYFGRELASGPKKSRSAAGGQNGKVGKNLVEKKFRSYDPEADRRHRLGIYEGAGALVGTAGVAATGVDIRRRTKGKVTRAHLSPKALGALAGRNKLLLAGAGATTAGAGGAVAARRSYLRDRNQPWT